MRLSAVVNVFAAMVEDEFEEAEAFEAAEDDWQRDSHGAEFIERTAFLDGVFELADLWTFDVSADEYVRFLRRVRESAPRSGLFRTPSVHVHPLFPRRLCAAASRQADRECGRRRRVALMRQSGLLPRRHRCKGVDTRGH
jgi:beta-glucosidase-like glycosyl hydrolase